MCTFLGIFGKERNQEVGIALSCYMIILFMLIISFSKDHFTRGLLFCL